MTADQRIALVRLKTERAKKHLIDLALERDRFLETNPYRVVESESDSQAGYRVCKVFDLQPPPQTLVLLAGDVIHNIRSALDHLAWHLVVANGQKPTRTTCFPVSLDSAKYKGRSAREIKGMSQDSKDMIDATKPNDADHWLFILHNLDIRDKHRTLLTSICCVTYTSFEWIPKLSSLKGGFTLSNFRRPLEAGDTICTYNSKSFFKVDLVFDIAFSEPGVSDVKPIIETLNLMLNLADDLILNFKPMLG